LRQPQRRPALGDKPIGEKEPGLDDRFEVRDGACRTVEDDAIATLNVIATRQLARTLEMLSSGVVALSQPPAEGIPRPAHPPAGKSSR